MELKGSWQDKSPFIKILLLVGFVFILTTLFTFIASFFTGYFFGINIMEDPQVLQDYERPEVMASLKLIQMITSLGIFILPPVIAAYLISDDAAGFLKLKRSPELSTYFLAVLAMVVSLPLINLSIEVNEKMNFPEMLKGVEDWMRGTESKAAELTKAFLNTSSIHGLLLNLLMIAVIPAIGEELFFRGYLQRIFGDWLKNAHVAIFVTAIIFSTFHMQFFGFLPRALLGVMLGYLFFWSGSLWVPVIAHFFNNAAAVIIAFLYFNGYISFDGNEIGAGDDYILPVVSSFILTGTVLYLIYQKERRQRNY
jgi:uncharacterized protein